jgi:hypothetical protein
MSTNEHLGRAWIRRAASRLSYANVTATVAVFIALSSGAWAAINVGRNDITAREIAKKAVGTSELKDDKAKGRDIDESSLGKVPSAAVADSAATATSASTATNANALGGIGPSGYVTTPTEPTRLVGTPGNPAYEHGSAYRGFGAEAGFFKDQLGIVHLQGDITPPTSAATIFTLPPGYRPTHGGASGPQFAVRADGSIGVVEVRSDGRVGALQTYTNHLSLNGLTFRAER